MVGPEETFFKMKVLRFLENAIFGFDFANAVLHPKKTSQNNSFQMAGKCYLEIDFANKIFHKRAILLIFEAEFTGSVV